MFKCTTKDQKFQNLTVNKDYEGTVSGEFIEITNDSGAKARYARRYFREVPTTRSITTEQFLTEAISSITHDGSMIVSIAFNRGFTRTSVVVQVRSSENSCGVLQLQGLNELIETSRVLSDVAMHTRNNLVVSDLDEHIVFEKLMERILRYIKVNLRCAFLMMTTNQPERLELSIGMTNLNYILATEVRENPNSNRDIQLWVADMQNVPE